MYHDIDMGIRRVRSRRNWRFIVVGKSEATGKSIGMRLFDGCIGVVGI